MNVLDHPWVAINFRTHSVTELINELDGRPITLRKMFTSKTLNDSCKRVRPTLYLHADNHDVNHQTIPTTCGIAGI